MSIIISTDIIFYHTVILFFFLTSESNFLSLQDISYQKTGGNVGHKKTYHAPRPVRVLPFVGLFNGKDLGEPPRPRSLVGPHVS